MRADPRIDAYIAEAAPFARPVLEHLRDLAHRALPGGAETIKWGMPHFMVAGKNVAGMAAFKAHCALTIHGEGRHASFEGMGQIGKVTSLMDLPPDAVLVARLQEARVRIETSGSAVPRRGPREPKPEIAMPEEFAAALDGAPAARAVFDGFPPGARREYLEWITEAKTAATRGKRIAQAVAWIAEGKKRNWKYEKC
ncbi:hypothetical protein B2G71_15265 [Novosphingobium sp. PC22D]|uniref:YdeI/OmpD-associated family protein n=1 Tax=Novosphingobium sp. PC22D TaxID=1962403 RepID=UPI000BF0361E|nr:YdeI/OmpD-associated family protein [Novosphingobium sp. PC22D]PEQ11801.1 hypothetical protein B2G71_15265 [Novosphingobium sp. PC22D]